jgi:peptidoglycan/xylan/chitin deacetylase (PgdA/CDA1 family)
MKKWYLAIPVIVVLAVLIALWEISRSRTFQFFGQIFPRVETSQKVVALTFDDGPTEDAVNQLLPVLDEQQVHATFFVIGAELEKNMAAGRRIVAAGHELGNHSYSHERMVFVTPGFVRQEVETTDQLVREAGYQGEILFRPPFGKKLFALPHYLARTGRKTITWDLEPDSYPDVAADANKITQYCMANVRPGSIFLLHVMYGSRSESMKSVRGVIQGLKQNGYALKTVSELLALEPANSLGAAR